MKEREIINEIGKMKYRKQEFKGYCKNWILSDVAIIETDVHWLIEKSIFYSDIFNKIQPDYLLSP